MAVIFVFDLLRKNHQIGILFFFSVSWIKINQKKPDPDQTRRKRKAIHPVFFGLIYNIFVVVVAVANILAPNGNKE